MQSTIRKNFARLSLVPCLLFSALSPLIAQTGRQGPPKVLVIMREFLKPGKSPSQHLKTESAYVTAMNAAKWPTYYFAMDSMSGAPRSLFFTGYDSFEAWQKDTDGQDKNSTLSAALDRAYIADGELLSSYDSGTYVLREELSLHPPANLAQIRFFEISRFVVRPGHDKEFDDLAKMYVSGYEKSSPETSWAVFQSMYGADNGGVFLVISPLKSLAETDHGLAASKQFMTAMGEDGMKKISEMAAASIASSQTNIFRINPRISYPDPALVQADPAFWKPKPAAAATKPAAKPAQ